MGYWRRRRCDGGFEDGIVDGRQSVSVIPVRSPVDGWIYGADVCAFAHPSALPIGVIVQDCKVFFAEAMASIGAVLHYGGLVIPVV